MSYSNDKPQSSKQVAFTGTGKRKVAVPSTASNQLKITTHDELKDPMGHYSRLELPIGAPVQKPYSAKPAKRPVGKDQL